MRNYYSPMKNVLTAVIAVGMFVGVNAQAPLLHVTNVHSKTVTQTTGAHEHDDFKPCPTHRLTDSHFMERGLSHLQQLGELERANTSPEAPTNRAVRTIPVVFHVVYDNVAATNVSDAVINNLLTRLNQDYRKNNSLIANIRPAFTGVAADAEIEFCLATKDPSGNPTTGINRRQTTLSYFNPDLTNNGINYASGNVGGPNAMKGATYGIASWDRSKYVNIWICDITNGANSGTAGYAYVPACSNNANCLPAANIDGIVLDYNIGVQNGNSRAISHEVGHYLGLNHTFGSNPTGSCGTSDDAFSDTPKIKGPFQNYYNFCSSSGASTAQSCVNGTLWQYENLMDYSSCFCMFTTMQANYMNAVLSGNRNSLVNSTTTNCAAATPVAPVANFNGCSANVNQGSTVTFSDISTGIPTSWSWSITPGTGWAYANGTSATSQNPQVTFTATGTYTVALTATNAIGSNTKTSSNCITVVTQTCNNLASPLVMGFEAAESLAGWAVENVNGDQASGQDITWGVITNAQLSSNGIPGAAHGGTQTAIYLYNTTQAANDWLYTPCLSLQAGTTHTVSFWYRAAQSNYPEKMKVSIGTAAGNASMTQTIVNLSNITTTTWIQSTTNFTVPATGNYYIGFHAYSAADMYALYLDDINISKQSGGVSAPVANFTGCGSYLTGTQITLTNTSTNSPTSNSWSITPATGWSYTGGTSATSANPKVTFTTPGTYTVALTSTNAGGSNTKTTQSCLVITANNAGIENTELSAGVSLFPNPSTGLTTVTVENAAQYSHLRVNVYNAVGQLIHNAPMSTDQINIDLSAHSKGIYFIEVRSNEAVTTKRLVLSK